MMLAAVAAVFMYHHVSNVVLPGVYGKALTVTPGEFVAQLQWLQTRGCKIVHASTLVDDARAGALAPCEVALTFDDGYDDAATFVAPLLESVGATGTFFISTGLVGTPHHLTVAQVRTLGVLGMELGAHTVHHVDLTSVAPRDRKREIAGSAERLGAWIGRPVTDFAYPAGRVTRAVERSVAAAGYAEAFTTNPGLMSTVGLRDIFALPRYRVLRGAGPGAMRSALGARVSANVAGAVGATEYVASLPSDAALASMARERIEGNSPAIAERVAIDLLRERFPEPIEKVHVLSISPASVAGIMLSGRRLHALVTSARFVEDARAMAAIALATASSLTEVDVWATVPQAVAPGTIVAGDLAAPTNRTVLSIAVRRGAPPAPAFVDAVWAAQLPAAARRR